MSTRYTMSVSPDFSPKGILGWYIFNTWLQKKLDIHIHLKLFDNFVDQREAIEKGELDLIYANPFDASMLVRKLGFRAITAPKNKPDETVVAVYKGSSYTTVEDLPEKISIVCTNDPEINLIGNILLEPADLDSKNMKYKMASNYVLVAKSLLQHETDVGFFLKEAYDDFSSIIQSDLRVLISSEIQVIRHVMLAGPRLAEKHNDLLKSLLDMSNNEKGEGVLQSMDLQAWEAHTQEDTEFMIDLMDTLQP